VIRSIEAVYNRNIPTDEKYFKNLAQFLDHPGFPWKTLIIGFGVSQFLLETWLSVRQHHKLCEDKVPKALEGVVSKEDYDKAQVSQYSAGKPC